MTSLWHCCHAINHDSIGEISMMLPQYHSRRRAAVLSLKHHLAAWQMTMFTVSDGRFLGFNSGDWFMMLGGCTLAAGLLMCLT